MGDLVLLCVIFTKDQGTVLLIYFHKHLISTQNIVY